MSGHTETTQALQRKLGILPTLAIGAGTMIGAGIFVFPGLAAERAGTGAFLSFLVAGGVALIVALCAAELATAIPRSGGVYLFVTQAIGNRWGFLVGLSQWLGLIFATSFYLSGFLEYFQKLLEEAGATESWPSWVMTAGVASMLVGVNILGADWFGRIQNLIVGILLLLLGAFVANGLLRMTGGFGSEIPLREPFSKGVGSAVTASALIFTSFLGFVQITTVGGEVRDPSRNLPRSLLGSVVLVTLLYALTLFVATNAVPPETMAAEGETAMISVAQKLLGRPGSLAMLAAGLLATLSSANASILSASRAVFALSRRGQAPQFLNSVSQRFGTPYYSLLATGAPVVILASLGPVETLAEVASCLHLVLYALIGVSLLLLRLRSPQWYQPGFRAMGGSWLGGVAAGCSLLLIGFMQPESILIASVLLGVCGAIGWGFLSRQRQAQASREEDFGN